MRSILEENPNVFKKNSKRQRKLKIDSEDELSSDETNRPDIKQTQLEFFYNFEITKGEFYDQTYVNVKYDLILP